MLPLGQLHQLWVVLILSARGHHKTTLSPFTADNSQLSGTQMHHPISCTLSVQVHPLQLN